MALALPQRAQAQQERRKRKQEVQTGLGAQPRKRQELLREPGLPDVQEHVRGSNVVSDQQPAGQGVRRAGADRRARAVRRREEPLRREQMVPRSGYCAG